jgi:hypothetical protein
MGEKPNYGQLDFNPEQRRGRWLTIASGQPGVTAPIPLTQSATLLVSRLEGQTLQHTFEPGRLGFLFVADGAVSATGRDDADAPVGAPAALGAGDAVRIAGVTRLSVGGSGEIVLWDVPRPPDGAND